MDTSSSWLHYLTEQLYALQQADKLCDAQLEGEDNAQVKFHSLLLAAASAQFAHITPPFILRCAGARESALQCIVHFLYTGSFDAGEYGDDELREIADAAEALDIQPLVDEIQSLTVKQEPEDIEESQSNEDTEKIGSVKLEEAALEDSEQVDYAPYDPPNVIEDAIQQKNPDDRFQDEEQDEHLQENGSSRNEKEPENEQTEDEMKENCEQSMELMNDEYFEESNLEPSSLGEEGDEKLNESVRDREIEDISEEPSQDALDEYATEDIQMPADENQPKFNENENYAEMKSEDCPSEENKNDEGNITNQITIENRNKPKFIPKHSKAVLNTLLRINVKPSYIEKHEAEREDWKIMQYTCTFCKLCFEPDEREAFIEHKKAHPEMRPYQCPICFERFLMKNVMESHRKSHTKETRESEVSLKEKRKRDRSVENTPKSSSKKKQRPSKETADDELNLAQYILDTERIKLNQYKCSICHVLKCGFENFLSHKLKHANVVPFHCKTCNKGFYRKSDWKRHEQKVTCRKKGALNVSLSTVLEGRSIEVLIKSSEIQRTGSKTWYKCGICDRCIASYDTFLAHKFDHAGIRPYVCKMCEKSFNRMYDYRRHAMTSLCAELHEEFEKTGKRFDDNLSGDESTDLEAGKLPDLNSLLKQVEEFEGRMNKEKNDNGDMEHIDEMDKGTDKDDSRGVTLEMVPEISGDLPIKGESQNTERSINMTTAKSIKEKLELAIEILETASHEQLMENLKDSKIRDNSDPSIDTESGLCLDMPPSRGKTSSHKYVLPEEKIIEDGRKKFHCSICDKTYVNLDHFVGHKMMHMQEKPFKCTHCSRGFVRKFDLKMHMKRHVLGLLYPCTHCKQEFTSKGKLVTHYLSNENQCKMPADMQWPGKGDKTVTANALLKFQCAVCGNAYASKQELGVHTVNVHEGKGMKVYKCEECSAVLTTKIGYGWHMKRHRNCKEFACDQCGNKFLRKVDLQSHKLKHSTEFNLDCPKCGKSFKHRNSLRQHMMLHSGKKPFLCKICGKGFTQKGNVRKHEQETHAETQNFSCKLCNKKFYTEGGLRIHNKSCHSTERPYVCKICLKGFIQRQNLDRHMLSHSDQRPYTCTECSKTFRMLAHAQRHLVNVHGMTKKEVHDLNLKANSVQESPAKTVVSELLQGSSVVSFTGENFKGDLPPNQSVPTLQIITPSDLAKMNATENMGTASDNAITMSESTHHMIVSDNTLTMSDNTQHMVVSDNTVVVKEDATEGNEPVLMLLDQSELSELQLQQLVMDDTGSLSTLQQVQAEDVIGVPQVAHTSTGDQVLYYVEYE